MRLIDANDLRNRLLCRPPRSISINYAFNYALGIVNAMPTVDAEPVRYGHWIRNDNGTYSCSECQSWIPNEQHYYARYCLYCGAKMDGERRDEDDH